MTTAPTRTRPGGVTLVIVLMWINAILEIIGGVIAVIASATVRVEDEVPGGQAVMLWTGILAILFGVVTIIFALALAKGSNTARVIVTILVVLQILANTWELATRAHGGAPWLSILSLVFWLVILGLLWTSRASAFFRGY